MLDGEYNALDLISFGLIMLGMEHVIMAFHQDSLKNTGKITSTQFKDEWACVKYSAVLRCHAIMEAAAHQGTNLQAQLITIIDKFENTDKKNPIIE